MLTIASVYLADCQSYTLRCAQLGTPGLSAAGGIYYCIAPPDEGRRSGECQPSALSCTSLTPNECSVCPAVVCDAEHVYGRVCPVSMVVQHFVIVFLRLPTSAPEIEPE